MSEPRLPEPRVVRLKTTRELEVAPRGYRTHLREVPFRQDWLQAGDYRARFLHAGLEDAPAVLLLGGVDDTAESYAGVLGCFGAHFSTYAVDFIGCGYTDQPKGTCDSFVGAQFLSDFMDASGAGGASIVATGLGTWYASRLAVDHPRLVRSLVLIAPHVGPGYGFPIVNPQSQAVRERALQNPTPDSVREVLTRRIKNHGLVSDDLVAVRLDALLHQRTASSVPCRPFYMDESQHRRNQLTTADLARVECPVMWILCNATEEARCKLARNIDAMHCEMTVVEWYGPGAWPYWEDPKQFCSLTIPFLLGS